MQVNANTLCLSKNLGQSVRLSNVFERMKIVRDSISSNQPQIKWLRKRVETGNPCPCFVEKNKILKTLKSNIFTSSWGEQGRSKFPREALFPWPMGVERIVSRGAIVDFSRVWPKVFSKEGQQWLNLVLLSPKLIEKHVCTKGITVKY